MLLLIRTLNAVQQQSNYFFFFWTYLAIDPFALQGTLIDI